MAFVVELAFAVSECSSDHVMAIKDGQVILTDGRPEVNDNIGLMNYHNQQDNVVQVNRDDVSQIIER